MIDKNFRKKYRMRRDKKMGKIFKIVIWFLSICSFVWILPVRADESTEYKEEVNSAFNILGERVNKVEKEVSASKVKVSGLFFTDYSYNLMEKGADFNAFEISRVYVTFMTKLTDSINARVTTDISRMATLKPQLIEFLKYCYVEVKDTGIGKITVGQIELPWVGYVEKIWAHRFVSKVFADSEGKQTSADLGISLSGKTIGEYLESNITLANGEGYSSFEANKAKDGYIRLIFHPVPDSLKGLKLALHHRAGLVNVAQKRDVSTAIISLEQNDWTIATEYLYTVDQSAQGKGYYAGSGYSIFGVCKLPANFSLIGRYDWFDPDINPDKKENDHFRVIYGIGYDISKDVKVTFDNQQVVYKAKAGKDNENSVYAHMLVKF